MVEPAIWRELLIDECDVDMLIEREAQLFGRQKYWLTPKSQILQLYPVSSPWSITPW
jgi:hypothetical protein